MFASSVCAQNNIGKTKFSKIEVASGLSNSNITAILQDSKGFMWFGTEDGLNKYDGYNFAVYRNSVKDTVASLRTNSIYCIFEDSNNRLWVSTRGGGVHYYDSEQDRFVRIQQFSNNCEINQILEDKQKNIWLAGKKLHSAFVAVLRNNTSRWQSYTVFESRETISSFEQESDNVFWIGVRNSGLFKWNASTNKIMESFKPERMNVNSIAGEDVRSLMKDKNGFLWVATSAGLSRFDNGTKSFKNFTKANCSGLKGNTISDFTMDGDYLWIATQNGGITRLDINNFSSTNFSFDRNDPYSLSDNSVWTIYRDRQNRIWCGTFSKGICVIDRQKEKFSELDVTLDNDVVNAILKDEKDRIWIGTEGGIAMKDGAKVRYFKHDAADKGSISSNPILTIRQDSQKRLWFGTWDGGINRYDEDADKFIRFVPDSANPHSLSNANVYDILEDRTTHQMVVATYKGLNVLVDERRGIFDHYVDGPVHEANNYLKTLYQDKNGLLWTGSIGELNSFDFSRNKRARFYIGSNGDSTTIGEINCMLEDKKGRFWIGAVNGLHQKINNNKFKVYTEKDGLPINIVNGILEDDKGMLWLSTTKGISMFNPELETFTNYDVSDGLISDEIKPRACFKSNDGQFFFGGKRVIVFYPDSIRKNPHVPSVFFSELRVNNQKVMIDGRDKILTKSISETSEISIPYSYNFFTLDFVALNFTSTTKNQYAYKLDGFDNDWIYIGNQRSATYTNLDPGTYTFRVKASNNDGLWNEQGCTLKITIEPPWWKTILFRVAALISLMGGAIMYYRYRVRSIWEQNKKLEYLVSKRTKELKELNTALLKREDEIRVQNIKLLEHEEELAAQNEELIQSQEEISAQRDVVVEQNSKLEEARNIIEEQHVKIKIRNKNLELEVDRRTKELVSYNRQLEQFAFMTAHNLRAPVARILGLGQVMELLKNEPNETRNIYEKLIYTAKELDKVVKDLNTILDVRNTNSLILADVNLTETLKMIRIILEKEILDTGTEFHSDFSMVPNIRTAKPYLESILINLVSNAIKYRQEGRTPIIKLHTNQEGDYVVLTVSDNGMGIDMSLYREKLFNLYSRFHTHIEGKGMGLYLVKTQIESLGGKIEVESEVDNGVLFRLYFKMNPGNINLNGVNYN